MEEAGERRWSCGGIIEDGDDSEKKAFEITIASKLTLLQLSCRCLIPEKHFKIRNSRCLLHFKGFVSGIIADGDDSRKKASKSQLHLN